MKTNEDEEQFCIKKRTRKKPDKRFYVKYFTLSDQEYESDEPLPTHDKRRRVFVLPKKKDSPERTFLPPISPFRFKEAEQKVKEEEEEKRQKVEYKDFNFSFLLDEANSYFQSNSKSIH